MHKWHGIPSRRQTSMCTRFLKRDRIDNTQIPEIDNPSQVFHLDRQIQRFQLGRQRLQIEQLVTGNHRPTPSNTKQHTLILYPNGNNTNKLYRSILPPILSAKLNVNHHTGSSECYLCHTRAQRNQGGRIRVNVH